jgi:hypothetical protein
MYVMSLNCVVQAFVVILNQIFTFMKSGEEGRQKYYSLGAAEYLAPALGKGVHLMDDDEERRSYTYN